MAVLRITIAAVHAGKSEDSVAESVDTYGPDFEDYLKEATRQLKVVLHGARKSESQVF